MRPVPLTLPKQVSQDKKRQTALTLTVAPWGWDVAASEWPTNKNKCKYETAFAILGMPVAVGGSEIGSVIYAFIKTVDDANVGFSYQPLLAHSQRVLSSRALSLQLHHCDSRARLGAVDGNSVSFWARVSLHWANSEHVQSQHRAACGCHMIFKVTFAMHTSFQDGIKWRGTEFPVPIGK